MHICIIGSGASGLIVANVLKEKPFVSKVTVISSPKIPHIGVGESTTLSLPKSHSKFNVDFGEFIRESHAAVKYGVYYQNWGKRDFLHFFKSNIALEKQGISARQYIRKLGNKPTGTFIHNIFGHTVWDAAVKNNNVFPNEDSLDEFPRSYHFDAAQYIQYMTKQALKSTKVTFIKDTVEDCLFRNDFLTDIVLESGEKIQADYYINTTGQGLKTKNVFREEYTSLGNALLTTKAVVYPLPYTDKRNQFHPYTVAKTMKHGWRWITPTWQRIGTGYVFSENHISVEQAIDEFVNDIGDKTIKPAVVDFKPRYNKQTYKINHCSIGMANGFLEPLDAPGLAMTNHVLEKIEVLLERHFKLLQTRDANTIGINNIYTSDLDYINAVAKGSYEYWVTFILNQYKTCHREDTQFWKDHKAVNWEQWNLAVRDLNAYCDIHKNDNDIMMLAQTIASRDIQYHTPTSIEPFRVPESYPATQHHLDFISKFHNT